MEKSSKRRSCSGFLRLPNEVIIDILFRLTLESIMLCKCVCKALNSLIDGDYFINLHLTISKANPSQSRVLFEALKSGPSISRDETLKRYLLNVDNLNIRQIGMYPHVDDENFPKKRMPIVSTLDGLICFSTENGRPGPVVIYNPLITGDYVCLPESNDRSMYAQSITLGFDPSINKYKVVKILTDQFTTDAIGCEVFTIGKDTSWRQIDFPHESEINFYTKGIFHQQGSIYWMVLMIVYRRCILEFDLTKEVFSVVDFPRSFALPSYSYRNRVQMQSLGDHISLTKAGRVLHIWRVVKQKNESSEVVGHRKMKLESSLKYAVIDGVIFLNNNEDLFLLRAHGGYDPVRMQNGERIREVGTYFSFYRPAAKKNNRLTNLPTLQDLFTGAKDVNAWCFRPSLVSIKKAMLA